MDAMLRHLGCGHDLRDFPGATTEKLALIRAAGARDLIAWKKTRARYELTSHGWDRLMPAHRFGVGSLMMSAAAGGIAGAVALAVFWLPADAPRLSAHRHSAASMARTEKPNAPQVSRSADGSVPSSAPLLATGVLQDVASVAAEPDTSAVTGVASPDLADRPAAEQPRADASFSGVKDVKKSRRKVAHHRRRDQGRTWAYADSWRAQSTRYAGYGGQRGWFGYR